MTPGKGQQHYWPKLRLSAPQKRKGPSCVSRGAEESCPSALTMGTDSLASLRLMSSLYGPLSHGDLAGRGRKMIHLCHSPI